jgi:myo-inositol catabolism protein IolC
MALPLAGRSSGCPSTAFLSGAWSADRAAGDIAAKYLQLVDAWQQSRV